MSCGCSAAHSCSGARRLAIITKMTLTQVSTWFANARRRLKKENKMTWAPRNRIDSDSLDADADADVDDEPTPVAAALPPPPPEPAIDASAQRDKMPRLDARPDARPHLQQRPADAPKDPLPKDSGTSRAALFHSVSSPLLSFTLTAIVLLYSRLECTENERLVHRTTRWRTMRSDFSSVFESCSFTVQIQIQ